METTEPGATPYSRLSSAGSIPGNSSVVDAGWLARNATPSADPGRSLKFRSRSCAGASAN